MFLCLVFQTLAEQFLRNRQAAYCHYLDPSTEQSPLEREMADLVIHTIIVLLSQQQNLLVQPLCLLAANPDSMRVSFFLLGIDSMIQSFISNNLHMVADSF